jgi:16S rRNA (cytidine1402-2'-O)-methyltransferase
VNDPGARLIAAARAENLPVTVLPGPSAVETALVASGLAAERYVFLGYLPRGERQLVELWEELTGSPYAAVAFESPRRLSVALRSLASVAPDRPVAVCRELTKRFEEVARGTAEELAARFSEPPKGEITLVIGPESRMEDEPAAVAAAAAAVRDLVAAGASHRRAVEVVAGLAEVPRNALYRASL